MRAGGELLAPGLDLHALVRLVAGIGREHPGGLDGEMRAAIAPRALLEQLELYACRRPTRRSAPSGATRPG